MSEQTPKIRVAFICTIPSAVATQAVAAAGADTVVIDQEHGALGPENLHCVAMTRYPPRGRRGFGPFIGHSRWGVSLQDYLPKVGGTVVCNILIETKAAIDN